MWGGLGGNQAQTRTADTGDCDPKRPGSPWPVARGVAHADRAPRPA